MEKEEEKLGHSYCCRNWRKRLGERSMVLVRNSVLNWTSTTPSSAAQPINKTFGWARLPSSAEEGWLREVRTPQSDHSRADGVVLVRNSCILLTNTTPSAPSKVAAQFLLDVAATPPQLRRGTYSHATPRHDETPCKPYRYAFARISHSQFGQLCPQLRREAARSRTFFASAGAVPARSTRDLLPTACRCANVSSWYYR